MIGLLQVSSPLFVLKVQAENDEPELSRTELIRRIQPALDVQTDRGGGTCFINLNIPV